MTTAVFRAPAAALFLLLCSAWASSLLTGSQHRVKSVRGLGDYDYYVFATEWPPAACVFENCRFFPDNGVFSIHGLWPSSDSDNPTECEPFQYDESNIDKSFKSELYSRWSGLWKSSWDFIRYECRKHGTCWEREKSDPARTDPRIVSLINAFDPNDPFGKYNVYLKIVVYLSRKIDTFKLLRDKGVVPSNSATYPLDRILDAMNSYFRLTNGVIPLCRKDKVSGVGYFTELRYCLDLNYNPVDCDPMTVRRNIQQCGTAPLAFPPNQASARPF